MVHHDWEFHESHTGFERSRICDLLPMMVEAGLVEEMKPGPRSKARRSPYRAEHGFAWISDRGRLVLEQMDQPPPPSQVELTAIGAQAQAQLATLYRQAAELSVTKEDICRLEDILRAIAEKPEDDPNRLEQAANLAQLLDTSQGLGMFLFAVALPFLRNVV